jgi:hypothetical protein
MEKTMIAWVQKLLASGVLTSIIRKLLTLLSGYLLALNVPGLSAETVAAFVASLTEIVIALIPYLIAQIWSLVVKAKK